MDVSILIISFNTRELILACLQSVFEQTRGLVFEVIVVDNSSTDGSAKAIAEAYPPVRLMALEENVGFARGNNLAAIEARGKYLLLLNPDTVVLEGAVQTAVAFAGRHPQAGIIGGRTFTGDMRLDRNSCHGRPTPWSLFCMGTGLSSLMRGSALFNPEALGSWQRDTSREVDAVTGCFLLIERRLWDRLGGFDEGFFMYGEDTDLCIRAWKAGSRCRICPDAKLIHYGGKSEKVRSDKMVKLFAAKAQLMKKHWTPGTVWFGVGMLKMWALSRAVAMGMAGMLGKGAEGSSSQWEAVWRRRSEYGARRGQV